MPAKRKILRISIPKPCDENWDAMTQQGEGKFCSNCKKLVVDFSQMTNKELLGYFSVGKIVSCGRFHNSQLNANLIAEETKNIGWKKWYKHFAAVLAIISMKYSEASTRKIAPTTIQPSYKKFKANVTDTAIVSGTVKNLDGSPVQNAEVKLGELVTTTDENGGFQFHLDSAWEPKSYILRIKFSGMNPVVRSYHPAMQSTSYNIVLQKPSTEYFGYTIGIIAEPAIKTPSVGFKRSGIELRADAKTELAAFARVLRENPTVSFRIIGYALTAKEIALTKKRQDAVLNYLIDQEGIGGDRFKPEIAKIPLEDLIEFIQITEQ
jgi:outer membrane protein OmpA-like peptidoglycan-associated protein